MYYIIGSLRNKRVPQIANELRKQGFEIFDSWRAPGPKADDYWRCYEKEKGLNYLDALSDYAARHIFEFDKYHLDKAKGAILVCPAGKSAHLELGYVIGCNKPGYILLDKEPKRWDVMLNFATAICKDVNELSKILKNEANEKIPWHLLSSF